MNINDKIRLFREDHQLSQEEMATKLSMSTKGYAKIERGETRVNFERLEQILRVLNADIYELLTYGEDGRIYICSGDNNTNSNIFSGNGDVEKLNLMLAHKDEIIKLKDDVIESLRNEISLLKEKLSTQQ
ncbi:helix-turn-helix transcriptional regulator [Glaesserella parasuis]|uniref:helix-turn-helix domain-containing protein n=1 Tax=Glaesserella parasuis TaxID=738 RepID=UPI0013262802|nr:helix-turn-helix transcriptional regulator [Glaesserella parasuis]MDG6267242.1 helix-turn-helix transcriptional regulator [Glaesserella parasuis]MWP99845.1 helix-turn-helix transcriptional regulator [Glaesserella parasuis]MWQ28569.1 helix-turn-helix transcriptional regulator [Glaesserella parasuis]MWQ34944.1 helix-turn-helix transcriptional regulator [Glaesserella parasuis]MWQ42950.1 helix-turn-helix domain-containing protein [Glaesserella parasuis]